MRDKLIYWVNAIWTGFTAFTFPICFGWIYLDITGHSKGYSYNLGAEKDISVIFGCIELIIWLALSLPSAIYVFRKTMARGRLYLLPAVITYILLAVFCIFITGGWSVYLKSVFNI